MLWKHGEPLKAKKKKAKVKDVTKEKRQRKAILRDVEDNQNRLGAIISYTLQDGKLDKIGTFKVGITE